MSEIRVNTVVAAEGTSAPNLPYGIQVPVGYGITGAGGINITGIITAANFDGTINTGAAGTFGGILKVTDTTQSSSTSTGALIVTGGVGIGKKLFVAGDTKLEGTTASTSKDTGALIVEGGVGIEKDIFVGDAVDVAKDINVGAAATIAGITKITANTSSTSTSTGALVVTGGAGIGGDVWIGAGLSVAGTLTYEDVTNVDSVGLITAKSGLNVSGGEVTVGSALTIGSVGVATFIGAAGVAVTITPSTGKVEATTGAFGPITATTIEGTQLTGTLQTAAQTNITSVGSLSALTVTGDLTLDNGSDAGKDITWDVSADSLIFNDSVYAKFGSDSDADIVHDGSNFYITNTTGTLNIRPKAAEMAIACVPDGAVSLYYDNSVKLATTNDGTVTTGIATFSAGANFDGILSEKFETTAGKLSDNTNIDLEDGMIHFFTTQETTTSTPNIRYNSSKSLNNMLTTGDSLTVTVITTAAAGGYSANWTVDGSAVTEQWNGGSAPSAGGADGYDVYTVTLLKTSNATFTVFANVSNFT